MSSYINCYHDDGLDWPKNAKKKSHFFKKMVVNRYANHVLSFFSNCMPQHYIHALYYYKTFHYNRYRKYKYILHITTLPYSIIPKHVITLIVKCPNMENERVCKFRSNIKCICILNTMRICFKTT
jgi:hypothetical protein